MLRRPNTSTSQSGERMTAGHARAIEALTARAVKLAEERALRELAELVVDLRQLFTTAEGGVDWGGRTRAYRDTVGEVFRASGLSDRDRNTLRYHVGNVLREKAPAEALDDLGLQHRPPIERAADSRARQTARARVGALTEKKSLRRANVVRLLIAAEETLAAVDDDRLSEIDSELVEDAVASLENTAHRAVSLLAALEPHRVRKRGGRRKGLIDLTQPGRVVMEIDTAGLHPDDTPPAALDSFLKNKKNRP